MRAIHLVGPDHNAGLEPLCGIWGGMDTGWTTVPSEVTCGACAAAIAVERRPPISRPPGARR
jgi:hypothetical protein